MKKTVYVCMGCGYRYYQELGDPQGGHPPGTAFDNLPDTWKCPMCGLGKSSFEEQEVDE